MAETLADRVDKSYASIAKEINGLQKVEQVLLDTADGVLDTKRRLEFAVQQILLELGDSIRRQTGDLNSTLARKVDDVTFSVIANQSTALTNMTTKLESELGQVKRFIFFNNLCFASCLRCAIIVGLASDWCTVPKCQSITRNVATSRGANSPTRRRQSSSFEQHGQESWPSMNLHQLWNRFVIETFHWFICR